MGTLHCAPQVSGMLLETLSESPHCIHASTPQRKDFLYFMQEETELKSIDLPKILWALKDSKCLQSFGGGAGVGFLTCSSDGSYNIRQVGHTVRQGGYRECFRNTGVAVMIRAAPALRLQHIMCVTGNPCRVQWDAEVALSST